MGDVVPTFVEEQEKNRAAERMRNESNALVDYKQV